MPMKRMQRAGRAGKKAHARTSDAKRERLELGVVHPLLKGEWWRVTPSEAAALQRQLAAAVDTQTVLRPWDLLAATDVSFNIGGDRVYAVVVVLHRQTLEIVDWQGVAMPPPFPYVPGLLSFREIPPLLQAFDQLRVRPDLLLVDGQGIAHPRRIGIASHLGLCLGLPAVGCAKSILCGRHDELDAERGARTPLAHHGEVIGCVLRTRRDVSPVYVSPGHLCRLEDAVGVVLETTVKYRLPEPIRAAHRLANALRLGAAPPPLALHEEHDSPRA
jgi:deoxyribonuclease V